MQFLFTRVERLGTQKTEKNINRYIYTHINIYFTTMNWLIDKYQI